MRETLARAPAPRIIALSGSLPIVTMEPFARFLIAMGYPEERLRDPRDGSYARGSFGGSARLAGMLAWHYERDGMMPMLIGHSEGGMLVVRTLHELAGAFADSVAVWDPMTDAPLPRSTIVDPRDGRTRPVIGLTVPYAAALATGLLPRLLLLQWDMLPRLRSIPGQRRGIRRLHARMGSDRGRAARRRAVCGDRPRRRAQHHAAGRLPPRHAAAGRSRSPPMRRRARGSTRTRPATATPGPSPDAAADTANLLHAADIWRSVRRHWCLEAQRLIRAAAPP